ncbi:MAG TPA: hypothetical protein VM757_01740 [Sphingomicrobium sp.]|jgi:hypothetical protein|nr:hypothetical protein [Sphingomicrobium sp.]
MKLFKKEDRDPIQEQAFAYRLSTLTHRTKGALDPYGRATDTDAVAA